MDLRQLRYFVAVARERNFTRAAEMLHIAQPPLSRQIRQLEDELGVQLLLRTTRPLRLTEAGRYFYEQALQILAHLEQTRLATRRLEKAERTVLSIGFVPSTLYGGLPELVRRLRQHHPDMDVQLVELMSIQQIEALKSGRIDIGFGRLRVQDPAVERMIAREERLVLAVSRNSPLAGAARGARRLQRGTSVRPLRLDSIIDQKLIVYPKEPRPSFADVVLSLLADRGVRPAEVQEVRELQTALGLVAAGMGVCLVPESVQALRSDIRYRRIDDKGATSPVIMTWRVNDDSQYIPLIRRFVKEMFS